MIPGPVEVAPQVLSEMASPMMAHYGEEWVEIYRETVELAKRVFQTKKGDLFLIPGSGSAGLDAALGSTLDKDKSLLVPINGWFGKRLRNIGQTHTSDVSTLKFDPGEAVDPNRLDDFLKNHREIDVVAVTHCETSNGIANPLKEIGEVCRDHSTLLVADAVSSLGGMDLKMDDWDVGICVTASQKAVAAPPGLALVGVGSKAWNFIDSADDCGWYLNLKTWRRYAKDWGDWHPYPITMAVNNVLALRRSLRDVLDEGLKERFRRHEKITRLLRTGLRNMRFDLFVEDHICSHTVTSVMSDSRISVDRLRDYLEKECAIKIAGGLGEVEGEIFRIGHMGPSANWDSVLPLLYGIETALREVGVSIPKGQFLRENA